MSQLIIESTISIVIGLYGMIDSIKSFKKYSNSENPITRVNNVLQPIFSLFFILLGVYLLVFYTR
jgi:hypothetical protein